MPPNRMPAAICRCCRFVPQVAIPTGRCDARAIAACQRKPRLGPGYPGRRCFQLGQAAAERPIGGDAVIGAKRRHMPGTGHDCNRTFHILQRLPDLDAHECLAAFMILRSQCCVRPSVGFGAAQLGHRRLNDRKDIRPAPGAFHERIPECLAVGMAGYLGDGFERISVSGGCRRPGLTRIRRVRRLSFLAHGERGGSWPIDEADRPLAFERPKQRPPFRRKRREWKKAGEAGFVGRVHEQRDRRLHAGKSREAQQVVGVGRSLDQHRGRIEVVERRNQARRRAWSMMPHAEQVGASVHVLTERRGSRGRGRTNRRARARRSPGIPVRLSGPALDP
jgi:hypothetical protein